MTAPYLVIGASSGIGAAVTAQLVEAGSSVIALNRQQVSMNKVTFYPCDVQDWSSDLPVIEGPLAGIVYLPGTVNLKSFQSLTKEIYQYDWEVNFLGAVRVIKAYLGNVKQGENGSIVLMSSVAASQGMSFHASIAAAKGAIEGFTRSLAAELSPNIRVNAVAPSLTATPLTEHLIKDAKQKEYANKNHPMQRIGLPEEVAKAVVFLLSSQSSWITGQVLRVDGGLSTLKIIQ
jgi:3-oxoacyl-[acyl-carrier protein] reductase